MPAASPTSANVMKKIAAASTHFRNGATPRNWFESTVSTSAMSSTGQSPVQNFDQRNARRLTGDVRMIQNAAPSADTEGNTKRTATAESTNAARARFTKA